MVQTLYARNVRELYSAKHVMMQIVVHHAIALNIDIWLLQQQMDVSVMMATSKTQLPRPLPIARR